MSEYWAALCTIESKSLGVGFNCALLFQYTGTTEKSSEDGTWLTHFLTLLAAVRVVPTIPVAQAACTTPQISLNYRTVSPHLLSSGVQRYHVATHLNQQF